MPEDAELLQQYVVEHSEAAFAALVRRHLDLVYSTALRHARCPQLAEEVAQSVFIDLARSAARLRSDTVLSAWLYQVAHRTAVDVVRREARRQLREQTAVMNVDQSSSPWTQVEPVLDDAMHELEEKDRTAILLRFFENKGLREVGRALGVSEDAARMRVNRALDHLRTLLEQRGVTVSAVLLGTLLSANALPAAPVALAATISLSALAAGAATPASAAAGANFTAIKTMAMTTTQKILAAVFVTAAVGTTFYEHRQVARLAVENQTLKQDLVTANKRVEQVQQQQRERPEAGPPPASLQETERAELMRLRGEVGPLRSAAQELNRLKAGQAAGGSAGSPPVETDIDKVAMARAQQLWQKLNQRPNSWIPELQLLQNEDWQKVAKNQRWDTEEEAKKAFAVLRDAGKKRFVDILAPALQAYAKANNGQPVSRLEDLTAYFDTPLEPTILDRYEIVKQGDVPNLRLTKNPEELIVKEKQPLDTGAGESLFAINAAGTFRLSLNSKGATGTAISQMSVTRQTTTIPSPP